MQIQTIGTVLMSVAIVQYGAIPLVADLNRTHATNPLWPKHARFHVVTQVTTGLAIASVALFLLWSNRLSRADGLCIATVLSICVLGAFFISALLRSVYGGSLSDEQNGIRKVRGVDLNTVNFGTAFFLLIVGRVLAQ